MKKNITRFITIKNGEEEIEEKKYAAAPYAEFVKTDKDLLEVRFYYSTAANIPLFYALFISLIIKIPMIIVQIVFLTSNFLPAMIIVLLIFNAMLFITAILMRQYKKSQSFELKFNKGSNMFTKLKMSSNSKQKLVFESDLSEILHLEIRSIYFRRRNSFVGTTKHTIILRLNDQKKIKFFYISYPNTIQILDYVMWICDFLEIDYFLTTPHAKKIFRSEKPIWD